MAHHLAFPENTQPLSNSLYLLPFTHLSVFSEMIASSNAWPLTHHIFTFSEIHNLSPTPLYSLKCLSSHPLDKPYKCLCLHNYFTTVYVRNNVESTYCVCVSEYVSASVFQWLCISECVSASVCQWVCHWVCHWVCQWVCFSECVSVSVFQRVCVSECVIECVNECVSGCISASMCQLAYHWSCQWVS